MKKWEISHEAAIKYFLMGSVATAFLLYGIALIYGAAGITDFDGLLAAYEGVSGSDRLLFLGGIAMISVGLAFKAALVPFHSWAPDVYNGAPTPVAAYLAVGSKAAAFAAFIRVFMIALPEFDLRWNEVMAWLAYASLIYANIGALRQYQLRSLFAYSGISHAGFMLMGLVAGGPMALSSLLFYISVYAFATFGAFAVIATIDRQSGGPSINDLRGLFAGSPWQALFFIFCILTLAGIPPTAGFFAKFALLKLAFGAGYYGLVITALLMTVLSAFYYLRLIVLTLSDAPDELKAPRRTFSATAVALTATATLVLLSLYPDSLLALLKPVQNL